jgi:hypothetical protein
LAFWRFRFAGVIIEQGEKVLVVLAALARLERRLLALQGLSDGPTTLEVAVAAV